MPENVRMYSPLRPRCEIDKVSLLYILLATASHTSKPRFERWEKRSHPFMEVVVNSHCKWQGYKD